MINFEKVAREYKRRNEINPEQLRLGFRDGLGSDDLLILFPIILLVYYDTDIIIVLR